MSETGTGEGERGSAGRREHLTSAAAGVARAVDVSASVAAGGMKETLLMVARDARRVAGADLAAVVVQVDDRLVIEAADGHGADVVHGVVRPIGAMWRTMLATGRVIVADLGAHAEAADLAVPLKLQPMVMVPMVADGQLLAGLTLARRENRPGFTGLDAQVMAAFAGYAALAVATAGRDAYYDADTPAATITPITTVRWRPG